VSKIPYPNTPRIALDSPETLRTCTGSGTTILRVNLNFHNNQGLFGNKVFKSILRKSAQKC
jgi:hypothetical protein